MGISHKGGIEVSSKDFSCFVYESKEKLKKNNKKW